MVYNSGISAITRGNFGPSYLRLSRTRLSSTRAAVVNSIQSTAMAIPTETLPCSNYLIMKVETTRVLGGAIRLAVTSSLNAMINVIIHPVATPFMIKGRVICRNT